MVVEYILKMIHGSEENNISNRLGKEALLSWTVSGDRLVSVGENRNYAFQNF